MSDSRKTASDASYHSRHARRTLQRAKCIASHIEQPSRILDVGCNKGITSKYLLDSGKASQVTGVELHASTVDDSLLTTDGFDLLEGNITEIDLQGRYDVIIYGAVHHHILNFHGLTTAIATLQKLVAHCDGSLFFETGQIGEGGRWPWQRAMRKYFRTDEEHFFYLLRSIEQNIKHFEVIGRFWIHGIRRSYLRIDIDHSGGRSDLFEASERIPWPSEKKGPLIRTFGSRRQTLCTEDEAEVDDSPTRFWTSSDDEGKFIKLHRHHPVAAAHEFSIGNQIDFDWAVNALGITENPAALVFHWLRDAVPVTDFAAAPVSVRRKISAQVLEIHRDAASKVITVRHEKLLPVEPNCRLIDVCDLNSNNFLVTASGGSDIVRVIDFEQQGAHYAYQNRMHLAKILWSLKQHRVKAVASYVTGFLGGVWWLLRYQPVSFAERVRARQPALISVLIADVRSIVGRAFGAVLRSFGLGEK